MKKLRNWLFKLALIIIARQIIRFPTPLTPEYLISKGFIEKDGYYFEPNVKDRDRVSILFEKHYYRVWHSDRRTFIGLESSQEWFDTYMLIIHPDNDIYKLAGI